MADLIPYMVFGLTRKTLKYFNIGKRIEEVFKVLEKYQNDVVENNRKSPCKNENAFINSLLDPKNGFDEDDVRDEFITMLLGVSMEFSLNFHGVFLNFS